MNNDKHATIKFQVEKKPMDIQETILTVHNALVEKGYNPISQIVGYIMSGDPSYITSYNGARSLIQKVETDEILEELVKYYVNR
ncbi:MAG: IreB family regulatory phosphoprotein [Clostridia bacterium]|nr:IreB family regulatory phosphoprotein [Clostridia bacterium]